MPTFRGDLQYVTKRGGVHLGLYVEAQCVHDAEKQIMESHIYKYPARKFHALIVKPKKES